MIVFRDSEVFDGVRVFKFSDLFDFLIFLSLHVAFLWF